MPRDARRAGFGKLRCGITHTSSSGGYGPENGTNDIDEAIALLI
jgi:hypothetical protein